MLTPAPTVADAAPVPFATLLSYYSKLQPGLSLAEWIELLSLDDHPIDIRRMIQFGVIKGFLRRVYAYPIWLDHPNLQRKEPHRSSRSASTADASGAATPLAAPAKQVLSRQLDAPAVPRHSTSAQPSRTSTPMPSDPALDTPEANDGDSTPNVSYPPSLALTFDGTHHTDEICLKYSCSWRTLELVLRHLGEGGKVGGGDASADEDDADGDAGEGARDVPRRGSAASAWDKAAGGYGDRVVMLHI